MLSTSVESIQPMTILTNANKGGGRKEYGTFTYTITWYILIVFFLLEKLITWQYD